MIKFGQHKVVKVMIVNGRHTTKVYFNLENGTPDPWFNEQDPTPLEISVPRGTAMTWLHRMFNEQEISSIFIEEIDIPGDT